MQSSLINQSVIIESIALKTIQKAVAAAGEG
jgi:hypothetical protein